MEDYYIRSSLKRPFQDLRMVFCGREAGKPLHSWGPVVRPTWIIHYILDGKGIFKTDAQTWHLHERQGFLIEPETQTFYQADAKEPWTYCWIGFEGSMAPMLVEELGLGEGRSAFCCDQKEELVKIFDMIFENRRASEQNDLILESMLFMFFAVLMKSLSIPAGEQAENNEYIRGAINYIRKNYYLPIQISEIAGYLGINRSYLSTLFRKETGMSPREYLSVFRLSKASEMLGISDSSIELIANSCGYEDAVVFSKAFKNKYGLSPMQYRKKEEEKRRDRHKDEK